PKGMSFGSFGAPDWIRTSGLQSRSLSLYPAELRARIFMRTAEAVVNVLKNSSQTVVNGGIFFFPPNPQSPMNTGFFGMSQLNRPEPWSSAGHSIQLSYERKYV